MKPVAAILAVALGLSGSAALAEGPAATCTATLAGGRVLIDVELQRFLDPDLLKLVRLGLEGNLQFELVLLRTRPFWFDELIERDAATARLRYVDEDRVYLLDDRREVPDPLRLDLERFALRPPDPLDPDGTYKVEVKATLRVVTGASLGKVASWIAGREPSRGETSDLSSRLLRAVADDLARQATALCEVVRPKSN